MPRARAILQAEFPYHISARCINRDWFEIPLERVWNILGEELYMATVLHELRVHSLVLMGNHFHLIASTPQANISVAMKRFMELTSKRLGEESKRINRIWGARHYKTVLGCYSYYLNAYKYDYLNPVRARIVERCEDYRFSTLRALLGEERLLFPVVEDTLLFPDAGEALEWLNRIPAKSKLEAVRIALRKGEFKPGICPSSRKPLLGDLEVI